MYDLIIIGGGPSGASAGRRAGKLGLNTLLLEKEEFPRYKPCAGGLSTRAISYLDFELPQYIIEREVMGLRGIFKNRMIEVHKDHSVSSLVSRSAFDNFLLKKARETKIEIHTGEKVLSCEEKSEFVEIITKKGTYQAKFAIVAEGAHGILKTCVRPADDENKYGVCVVTEVLANEDEIEKSFGSVVEIHFGVADGGYGWIFPHKNYYSVGIGGIAKDFPRPREKIHKFLINNGFTGDYKLKGHKIPLGGIKRKISGSRVLLSGDAAGFVDAVSGEGLAYAISSGQFAAEVIAGICRRGGNIKDLSKYESLCQAEFGTHLKYSLISSKLIHRFPELSFNMAIDNREILSKSLDVVNSSIDHKSYFYWSLKVCPLFFLRKFKLG
ncbi:MAG: geranylgeranyl reductase family protein [Methanosarcina sp.]|nr:geranylgeranyl reductase family protein [Methanosarcina sp.]MDD3873069.1 geranylgeranyl reductase family protein [Methanosarcina sp.]MDD4522362.1 geranylgeranyl reductase family protein [Methanosarcina sp.]